jgi:hypothetical protein
MANVAHVTMATSRMGGCSSVGTNVGISKVGAIQK